MNTLSVKQFASPKEAPNYKKQDEEFKALNIEEACIVRNGTESGRSTVDIILEDQEGNKYVAMITGRLITNLANVIGPE